jgi:hypothetical protein
MRFNKFLFLALALLPASAFADLLTFTAPSGSWSAAQATAISGGARSIRVINPLSVPINVRVDATDADTGAADARVDAGDALILTFVDGERPAEVAVYGIGGTGSVYVETYAAAMAVEGTDRVNVGLSSGLPVVAGTATAGVSVLGSAADHVHPVQPEGSIAETSIGSESGNTRRLTWTVSDAAGAVVNGDTCEVSLHTSAMAFVDGSADGAFSLVTGTALTTNATASNVRMILTTSSAGVVALDIIDKSGSLSGNLIVVIRCPSVGAINVATVAFT